VKSTGLLKQLQSVRCGGPLIERIVRRDQPGSLQAAYRIAAALTAGAPLAGYKVGATNARGRALLRLKQPFYGRILQDTLYRSPATLRLGPHGYEVEMELGCELGTALPARSKRYTRAEVAASVRKIVPLIELNAPSFRKPMEVGGLCLIADNGVNVGAIIGTPGSRDLYTIGEARATLSLNGVAVQQGQPACAPDDPLSALIWLANALSKHDIGLQEGQIVATGALAPPLAIREDCTLEADFGALGGVHVTFVR